MSDQSSNSPEVTPGVTPAAGLQQVCETKPLWPRGVIIPIIGLAGLPWSGKSTFALSICPGLRTLCHDFEKSCCGYAKAFGCEYVDFIEFIQNKYQRRFTAREVYETWIAEIQKVPAGKYSVIMVDGIDDIEEGLVSSVTARYAQFGYSTPEKFASTKGIFWKKVSSEWKRVILDVAARCETFVFTVHMRQIYIGGEPTAKYEPRGKDVLIEETPTLFLILERQGAGKPPAAIVYKDRLQITKISDDGEVLIRTLLPDRLPVATPAAIRQYILNPPDFENLSEDEQVKEKSLTETERLAIEAAIAKEKRLTAEKEAEIEATRARMAERRAAKQEQQQQQEAEQKKQQEAAQPPTEGNGGPAVETATDDEVDWLVAESMKLDVLDRMFEGARRVLLKRGVEMPDVSDAALLRLLTKREMADFRNRVLELKAVKGE